MIQTNLNYLLQVYQQPTTNLWEEYRGYSFFARAVQLRFFREITNNTIGNHGSSWRGQCHFLARECPFAALERQPLRQYDGCQTQPGYDANIDIVSSVCYGAIDPTDTKLIATAAILRQQWADPTSQAYYPINGADSQKGLGPLFGRYPGDHYDGDVAHPVTGGHPWALCTANFAEFQYRLANAIDANGNHSAGYTFSAFLLALE